jgi:hypothetical protein
MPRAIGQDFSDRGNCQHYFAVCESCFLIATILESRDDYNFAYCPRCLEKENLSLIPVSPHEVNEMSH